MGGKSQSSTSTATTQNTTNTQDIATTSVGLDNTEFGVVGGGDVSVTQISTDQGAVSAGRDVAIAGLDTGRKIGQAAFDTVGEVSGRAIDSVTQANDRSLDFGSNVVTQALGFGTDVISKEQQTTSQGFATLGNAIDQAAQATRSDTADSLTKLAKYGAVALAVIALGVAAVFIFRR